MKTKKSEIDLLRWVIANFRETTKAKMIKDIRELQEKGLMDKDEYEFAAMIKGICKELM